MLKRKRAQTRTQPRRAPRKARVERTDRDQNEQQVSLDQLSEAVLVEVMQYLDVKDLLACRLVCKKLQGLARHPDVWKRRRLARDGKYRVLRLAPCLAFVYVRPLWLKEPNSSLPLPFTTSCAIEELYFYLHDVGFGPAIALLVRRQASFGRLRRITLSFKDLETDDAAALLPTIVSAAGLEHLEVRFWGKVPSAHYSCPLEAGANVPSSIKSFRFEYVPGLDPFFKSVMSTHAATLETVQIIDRTPPASILEQLFGLPHLREVPLPLRCLLETKLAARLAASKTLEVLTLQIEKSKNGKEMKLCTAAAVQFFSKASQLRKVSFECKECFNDTTIKLIRALASGKSSSRIESLSFIYMCEGQDDMAQALFEALPALPALRELRLYIKDFKNFASCDKLLKKGITPATAPSLRDLWLMVQTCTHFMSHYDAVKAVLTANPALHLRVVNRSCGYSCRCVTCKLRCHAFLKARESGRTIRRNRGRPFKVLPKSESKDKSPYACLVLDELSPKHSQNCTVVKVV